MPCKGLPLRSAFHADDAALLQRQAAPAALAPAEPPPAPVVAAAGQVLLTNDLRSAVSKRITRYAQRTVIENSLADSVDFFHLDALSSAVGMKIDFDVTLTEVSTGLYRMLAQLLPGYEAAKSRQLFRHFLNTGAQVEITDQCVQVTLPKRAHNPLL